MNRITRTFYLLAPAAALIAGLSAQAHAQVQAQYKVVSPDGKVTYTDTPPVQAGGSRVTKLGENVSAIQQASLPLELRQATQRFPVTLYVMKVCEPCDSARAFLRQRGVPFSEKLIVSAEDGEALQRISGGRDTPTLTIGAQVLRGLTTDTWSSYLDSAGYPHESHLPANYQYPAATTLTEPAPPIERKAAAQQPQQQPQAPTEKPAPGGIKF
jgi:glutaredoxin